MKFFHLIKRTISSVDSPEPYLLRWEWNTPLFTVKLHRFVRSDLAPLHDHPWWFLSFVLWGGYEEYLRRPEGMVIQGTRLVRRRPFSLAFRRATDQHRVDIGARKHVWTLVLTGPKKRSWYFYPERTNKVCGHPPLVVTHLVRVPWRVAVAYGENHVATLVKQGWREEEFEEIDRGFRAKEMER